MIAALLKAFPAIHKTLAKMCRMPYILAQSAVPAILAPNGTVAANGRITLGTALPTTYSGGAWVRLPAGAISGGSAGLYWTVFSSTTVGQVYTIFADPSAQFVPYIPSGTLTAATGSGSAYTQTTAADITLANVTVPGGAMGLNGEIRLTHLWFNNNSATGKGVKAKLAAQTFLSQNLTTTMGYRNQLSIVNRGSPALNSSNSFLGFGTTTYLTSSVTGTINTAGDQPFTLAASLADATDYLVVESFTVEVLPS